MTDYREYIEDLSKYLMKLGADVPEVMQQFQALNKAANKEGVLDLKTKELIALAIGGLMSAGSLGDIATQMENIKTTLREMGCPLEDPVFTLGFLSFSALPWIRLTPSGLLDVKNQEIL